MNEATPMVEKKKSVKAPKVEAPQVNVSSFMRDPKNWKALKAVADDYGRNVRLDGQKIVHDIPADQLPAMIAMIK
jgi:hypothetical protein